ncbi:MAG: phospholipid carrier-dependent glycosyltransferase [Phycisphaerae bacterium]|nr:phospholipid carrier-dependent glycosyltransferase [Phycisphaerae bacterium]
MMRKGSLLLILGYLMVYILPLGVRPLVIPDETRYAQMGREILDSGDWIVPHLNGLRYFEKPILGHWAHAISLKVLGNHAFAARLPSALAAGVTAVLLLVLVSRFGGGPSLGLLCAGFFLTCIEVFIVGTLCVLDSLLALFVTGAMVAFFFAYHADTAARKRAYAVLFGLCCGLAFLTKGLLGVVIPGVAIVPFLIWQRRTHQLFRHLWLVIVTFLAVAAPWLILIQRREPDFWHYFFWVEHVERFLKPGTGQHQQPFWYFIPVLVGGCFPWTLLLVPAGLGLRKLDDPDGLLKYAICWLVFPFLFFSASGGKLATYILPCFVPLALLLGKGLWTYCQSGTAVHFKGALRNGAILSFLLAIGIAATQLLPQTPKIYGLSETWKWQVMIAGGLLFAGGFYLAARVKTVTHKLTFCLVSPLVLMCAASFILPDQLRIRKMPGEFLRKNMPYLQAADILFADEVLSPTLGWFAHRQDIFILGEKGELDYGLGYSDAKHRFLKNEEFKDFLMSHADKHVVFLTRTRDYYNEYEQLLPPPTHSESSDGFTLLEYDPELVLGL